MANERVNSNRILEIDTTGCYQCGESFYEFRDYELSECPHCKGELANACSIDGTKEVRIEVDSITGKITLDKEQQQEIEGLEEQANAMAEKHAEKDIIMSNMQQEIERYRKALDTIAHDDEVMGTFALVRVALDALGNTR